MEKGTLPVGGVMADFNFLSTEINMYYIRIKTFLSSLRKTLRDCSYFCCCQGVSTFQAGRRGFSSRAGNSFCLLHSPFPIWGNHFKDSPSPSCSAGFVGFVIFIPTHHLPSEERQPPQGWPHVNTSPFPSIPYLMGHVSALLQRARQLTCHWNKQSYFFFLWRNHCYCFVNLFLIMSCII